MRGANVSSEESLSRAFLPGSHGDMAKIERDGSDCKRLNHDRQPCIRVNFQKRDGEKGKLGRRWAKLLDMIFDQLETMTANKGFCIVEKCFPGRWGGGGR